MNSKQYLSLSGLSIFYSKFKEWISSTFTTKEYVDTKIADLVNSAPDTLDTLGELATAFQENKEVVDVLNEAIVVKADKTYVDESIANIPTESDIFIIDCPDGSIISHTFEQILTAVKSNKTIYASIYGSTIIPLNYIADNDAFIEFNTVRCEVAENQNITTWVDRLVINSDNSFSVQRIDLIAVSENKINDLMALLK